MKTIMISKLFFFLILLILLCTSCDGGQQSIYNPKPRSYPKIEFPAKSYTKVNTNVCPFSFERADYAEFVRDTLFFNDKPENECWFDLFVPSLNGTIHCSYYNINSKNTLDKLITDAYTLSNKHGVKADYIDDFIINKPGNVYLGVAHRLDRPTSGIVVFAKSSKALPRLNKLFAEKAAKKTYWAVVKNVPEKPNGSLVHWLKRNTKQNKSYAHYKEVPESKKAILEYRIVKKLDRYTLLEIDLKTGRHHQIRAQLSAIGCPIKGDLKYGVDRSNPDGSIHLHARKLSFIHPVKKEMLEIIADPPTDPVWNACC